MRGYLDGLDAVVLSPLGEHGQDLRDGKQADQCGDDVDAAAERVMEDETLNALHVVIADRRQPHADAAGKQPLDDGVGIQRTDHGNAEDGQPEQVRRSEGQRPLGEDRGQENQQEHAEQAADE